MQRSFSEVSGSQASYRDDCYDRGSMRSSRRSEASYVSGSCYDDTRSMRSGRSKATESVRSKGSTRSVGRGSTAASQRDIKRSSVGSQGSGANPALSSTAVTAPPGYSGYIPGVAAGNVIGHTFARANKVAAKDLSSYRRGSVPRFDPPQRGTADGTTYSAGAKIPGYAGFVPGVYAGNLIGTCTPRAAKAQWEPNEHGPRPKLDRLVPGMNN